MKTVLFCIPLKQGYLDQYKSFVKETVNRKNEYKDLLKRYDIFCARAWYKTINHVDYVFVYHEVGDDFENKMQGWEKSSHPFDQWFNAEIMKLYDINNVDSMEKPIQLLDFIT